MPTGTQQPFMTADELLKHWQGHRRLTRRVIEKFPEDQLFSFSIGGMRPFGALALELLSMAAPMVRGLATDEWDTSMRRDPRPKSELLAAWDESTAQIEELWAQIPAERFHERLTAFGLYEGMGNDLMMYVVDNEIHHRGQGFVYLRALGVEPPPFFARD